MRPAPRRPVMACNLFERSAIKSALERICDPSGARDTVIGVELRMRLGRDNLPVREPATRLFVASYYGAGHFAPWSKVMLDVGLSESAMRALATIHEDPFATNWLEILDRVRTMCSREDGGSETFSLTLTRYGGFVINESLRNVPTHENTAEEVARFVYQRELLLHRPCRSQHERVAVQSEVNQLSDLFNNSGLSAICEGSVSPIDLDPEPITLS